MTSLVQRTLAHFHSNFENKKACANALRKRFEIIINAPASHRDPRSAQTQDLMRKLGANLRSLHAFIHTNWSDETQLLSQLEMREKQIFEVTQQMKDIDKLLSEIDDDSKTSKRNLIQPQTDLENPSIRKSPSLPLVRGVPSTHQGKYSPSQLSPSTQTAPPTVTGPPGTKFEIMDGLYEAVQEIDNNWQKKDEEKRISMKIEPKPKAKLKRELPPQTFVPQKPQPKLLQMRTMPVERKRSRKVDLEAPAIQRVHPGKSAELLGADDIELSTCCCCFR